LSQRRSEFTIFIVAFGGVKMTSKEYVIESTLTGRERVLSLPSLFTLFQDVASTSSEDIGFGRNVTLDAGLLWVVTRVNVEITRLPDFEERVVLSSWPASTMAFVYPRCAEMKDLSGNSLVKISSYWALIEDSTRKLILNPSLKCDPKYLGPMFPRPEKVKELPSHTVYSKKIRYSDVDMNHHLNNVRYIEALVDALPEGFFETHKVKSFLVNYDVEVKEGETLDVSLSDDFTYGLGSVNGERRFECNFVFD